MKKHSYRAVEAFRGADKTIRIVGHRGARGVVPENTMLGFKSMKDVPIMPLAPLIWMMKVCQPKEPY